MDVDWLYNNLFSILGVCIAVVTATAAIIAARNTLKASERTAFEQRFTLLLEQHNKLLESIKEEAEKAILNKSRGLEKGYDPIDVFLSAQWLHEHPIFSPYMRVLYHTLKHVDHSFYIKNCLSDNKDLLKQKKHYTSLLRSFIPNDVLYLVALNCAVIKELDHKEINNDYYKFQKLLNRFSFFEHADFLQIKYFYKHDVMTGSIFNLFLDNLKSDANFASIKNEDYKSLADSGSPMQRTPIFLVYIYNDKKREVIQRISKHKDAEQAFTACDERCVMTLDEYL